MSGDLIELVQNLGQPRVLFARLLRRRLWLAHGVDVTDRRRHSALRTGR